MPGGEDPSAALIEFWFGAPGSAEHGQSRDVWFKPDPQRAASGALDHLQETAEGALALALLLDQLPRNLYRGDARAFATDAKARAVADAAIARGFDQALAPFKRWFLYLPFEHSEDLADQDRSVALHAALGPDHAVALKYAESHRAVIHRFGRFPHRNAVLGRASTAEELAFIEQEGTGF
jgi:uncharacterized protein (DUF924 family)